MFERVEDLVCVKCGATLGTVAIDADGMHGDPIIRDGDRFVFGGHYMSGELEPRCPECSD